MTWDIQSLGSGAGAGIIGAILVAFGFNRRVNNLEENKQDMGVCEERWKQILTMKEDIVYIRSRIDKLMNQKG